MAQTSSTADTSLVLDELRWRGLIHQASHEDALRRHLASPRFVYCGFDPTADSLTIVLAGDSAYRTPLAASGMDVRKCGVQLEAKEWTIWLVEDSRPVALDTVRYGVAPAGYRTTDPSRSLGPGCYEVMVFAREAVHFSFDVGPEGRIQPRVGQPKVGESPAPG